MNRREFLKLSGAAAVLATLPASGVWSYATKAAPAADGLVSYAIPASVLTDGGYVTVNQCGVYDDGSSWCEERHILEGKGKIVQGISFTVEQPDTNATTRMGIKHTSSGEDVTIHGLKGCEVFVVNHHSCSGASQMLYLYVKPN